MAVGTVQSVDPLHEAAARVVLAGERPSSAKRRGCQWCVRDVVWLSACCGLAAGFIESLYWFVTRFVLGEFTYVHDDVFWMAPVAYLVLFLVIGLPVSWLMRRVGQPAAGTAAIIVLTMAGSLCALSLFPQVHLAAQLLLTLGAATQFARWSEQHPHHARWIVRRAAALLGLATVVVAIGQVGQRMYVEHVRLSALPAAAEQAPNVLLVVLDTVRADALGAYGATGDATPRLDALARHGVLFEQATSTASWTLPATASLMTGRLPSELSADWLKPLDAQQYALAELMRDNGYATAGFVGNYKYATAETGLARGFAHYDAHSHSLRELVACTAVGRALFFSRALPNLGCYCDPVRRTAREVNNRYLAWADAHRERPQFAFINYLDVHDPYAAPAPYDTHAPSDAGERSLLRFWWFLQRDTLTSDEAALARNAYTDCLQYLDDEIGRLLGELEARNVLKDTVVIITADHGEHFGEHNLWLHGNSLYQPLVHVPLMVIAPGRVPEGRRIAAPVSTADIAATLQNVLGLRSGAMPGRSLAALWNGTESEPRPVISEVLTPPITPPCQGASPIFRGSMRSVRLGDLKLICNEDGGEELFDLATDPSESQNLAALPERQADVERLRSLFKAPQSTEVESDPARLTADR